MVFVWVWGWLPHPSFLPAAIRELIPLLERLPELTSLSPHPPLAAPSPCSAIRAPNYSPSLDPDAIWGFFCLPREGVDPIKACFPSGVDCSRFPVWNQPQGEPMAACSPLLPLPLLAPLGWGYGEAGAPPGGSRGPRWAQGTLNAPNGWGALLSQQPPPKHALLPLGQQTHGWRIPGMG